MTPTWLKEARDMTHNTDEPIIEVHGLWKRYGLPPFLPWRKKKVADHEWALRDISFSVPRGGSLGILGRNGAGKSTLLKLLAGVTPPDKGSIAVRGKIFPMIELTAGMSMELSGLENIRILGTIMGLNNKEIENIIPNVEDFSELGDWLYKPVWQYSSGMMARLAFGIAVNMRADILLVDEVLAVGDIMFQKKCQVKIQEILAGGATLVFVSHSPYQMERLCEQGLLFEHGGLVMDDAANVVMREYLQRTVGRSMQVSGNDVTDSRCLPLDQRPGTGDIRFTKARVESESGLPDNQVKTGETVTITLEYDAKSDISNYNFNIIIHNILSAPVAMLGILPHEKTAKLPEGQGEIVCTIPNLPLVGEFFLSSSIKTTYLLDRAEYLASFSALIESEEIPRTNGVGDVYIKPSWTFLTKNSQERIMTQEFDTFGVDAHEITVFQYCDADGNFDYSKYKEIQIAANLRKLELSSIDSRDIEMLSKWLLKHVTPLKEGLCHGTRNGKEQMLFREFTNAEVWGTDISPTAEQFTYTLQHDFHEVKPEWLDHFDFVFSNSYDHSYNLEYCIRQWMSSVRSGGVCILEHSNGYLNVKASDPIGISQKALCQLINRWGCDLFTVRTILPAIDKNSGTDASFEYKNQVFIIINKL
ncbi:MAG: ABC transporter ATP-binding protein [Leptospirales bacterium]|nr:ABC transporter ATP-binding protein [Leptospirales bacterium]